MREQRDGAVREIDLSQPLELIVLGVKKGESARCRLTGKGDELTLRASGLYDVVPGEMVTVTPKKHWIWAGHPYLSADIINSRFDLPSLGLSPLKLNPFGMWDPAEHYWGEEDEVEQDWEREIKTAGPRPQYEMEKILPGEDPLDFDSDPILEAVELDNAGDPVAAGQLLNGLLISDLRCLDAHAHLGNLAFDRNPVKALRHYDIGRQIGELSLGSGFQGVLLWGMIDNRPYLRCLHGYGLCLWRHSRFDEAAALFTRMLWLNPSDNQGARFNLEPIQAGSPWKERACS